MTALFLAAALAVQSPSPQLPSAAVPTPQGWGPPPAAAAAPAPLPVTVFQTPSPPAVYQVTLGQPQTYVLQAVPPPAAAIPVFAPASSQFSPASSPYVNPFVTTQAAPAQPQQGIGTVALVAGTLLVDHPWIFDRIAGSIGNCLAKRGHPKILIAPPGSQPTAPAGSSAAPVYLALPSGAAVQAVPYRHSRTAAGRWFFGE